MATFSRLALHRDRHGRAVFHRELDGFAKRLGRLFDENREEPAIVELEYLRGLAFAYAMPLAEIEIDDDSHASVVAQLFEEAELLQRRAVDHANDAVDFLVDLRAVRIPMTLLLLRPAVDQDWLLVGV